MLMLIYSVDCNVCANPGIRGRQSRDPGIEKGIPGLNALLAIPSKGRLSQSMATCLSGSAYHEFFVMPQTI